ncbi:hypothetical protein JTB14_012465 [Gonioctena quinquepunctata]|nr:hypothetical protein JTB14_012465 [Gonioctena quinquepunctata]
MSSPPMEDHSSGDLGYRIQEIGTPQPENIPHSWPRPTVSGSNNDYPHMIDQVSMEHNENIHHTWPQPSVPVPNNQNRPDQVPVL